MELAPKDRPILIFGGNTCLGVGMFDDEFGVWVLYDASPVGEPSGWAPASEEQIRAAEEKIDTADA